MITELFNKETKETSGPFRSGYSTNIEAVITLVRTIHVHSKLRMMLEHLRTKTSAKHKEVTPGSKKKHVDHVASLKAKLRSYGLNQFAEGASKSISTGDEIDQAVVHDMLHADVILEGDVVVVAKDTDVLILMIWAYHALEIRCNWFMKYDHDNSLKSTQYANLYELTCVARYLQFTLCLAATQPRISTEWGT